MLARHDAEKKAFREEGYRLERVIEEEMRNHDYIHTGNPHEILIALGYDESDLLDCHSQFYRKWRQVQSKLKKECN